MNLPRPPVGTSPIAFFGVVMASAEIGLRHRGTGVRKLADGLIVRVATGAAMMGIWQAVLAFVLKVRRFPRLCPPVDHHDRFFWRKLFDHNPLFQVYCNKLACKEWVRQKCPDLAIPDTLWQGNSVNEMPADLLAEGIIIKANNGSGFNIRIEKQPVDRHNVERNFARWLSKPYGQKNAEWGYRHVPRLAYVEKLITSRDGAAPVQMNVYTVMGEPRLIICIVGWKGEYRRAGYFDLEGSRIPLQPSDLDPLPARWQPPAGICKLAGFARVLAAGSDQIRCDFMGVGKQVWFSEMTVYPLSGLEPVEPDEDKVVYGGWDIAQSWFLQNDHSGWKKFYANSFRRILNHRQTGQ